MRIYAFNVKNVSKDVSFIRRYLGITLQWYTIDTYYTKVRGNSQDFATVICETHKWNLWTRRDFPLLPSSPMEQWLETYSKCP